MRTHLTSNQHLVHPTYGLTSTHEWEVDPLVELAHHPRASVCTKKRGAPTFGPALTLVTCIKVGHLGWKEADVGARTLMVLKVGNSAELWEFVSGVTTQNSLRGVGVE